VLAQVNASPSLSTTTDSDRILKTQLLDDIFSVVFPPDFPSAETSQGCTSWNPAPEVGQFVLIYDEAAEMQKEEAAEAQAEAQKAGGIKGGARRMGSWR
jgi:tubulin polyglutamylase TTLL1